MFEMLINNLSKYSPLNAAEIEMLQASFTMRRYRKRQYLLQEGDIARHTSFIVKGLTRTFEVDEKGQEHVVQFGQEDSWVGDIGSFVRSAPTVYNIDCLEDTLVYQISYEQLERLYEQVPKVERHFRKTIERAYMSFQNRMSAILSKSASERYFEFIANCPGVSERIHDHQIASYLGITPQSLSRIRSQTQMR